MDPQLPSLPLRSGPTEWTVRGANESHETLVRHSLPIQTQVGCSFVVLVRRTLPEPEAPAAKG